MISTSYMHTVTRCMEWEGKLVIGEKGTRDGRNGERGREGEGGSLIEAIGG